MNSSSRERNHIIPKMIVCHERQTFSQLSSIIKNKILLKLLSAGRKQYNDVRLERLLDLRGYLQHKQVKAVQRYCGAMRLLAQTGWCPGITDRSVVTASAREAM